MAFIVKENSGGNFEMIPEDQYSAVCYRIIDLGTHETDYMGVKGHKRQLMISWEIDSKMEDGRRFSISKWYTRSLNEKSKLRPDLESWRGKSFSDEELEAFDISKLIGVNCLLQISHKIKKNGQKKAEVNSIMRLPKGMTAIEAENEAFVFDMEESFDSKIFDKIPNGIKAMINTSPEYIEWIKANNNEEEFLDEDEIVF